MSESRNIVSEMMRKFSGKLLDVFAKHQIEFKDALVLLSTFKYCTLESVLFNTNLKDSVDKEALEEIAEVDTEHVIKSWGRLFDKYKKNSSTDNSEAT